MEQSPTIKTQEKPAHANDAALHAESMGGVENLAAVSTKPKQLQAAVQLEPTKRSKTWGERLFDLTTYGGFALVGNEITSTAIVEQRAKSNVIGKAYRAADKFFQGIGKPGELPYLQKRLNYISFAIIGGFVMVPFVKFLEDNKGRLVRFADKILYGDKAKTDQEIVKKHEEMDNAPNQTWGSLGKGRVLTVAAAYAVDATINWNDGLSAKLLKGTRFENYSSLEHLSDRVAEWANKPLSNLRKLTPQASSTQKGLLKTLFGLGTLSATLTALFYISSKIFAKKRDEKIERRAHSGENELLSTEIPSESTTIAQEKAALTQTSARPESKISSVAHQATLGTSEIQLATSH